MKNFITIALLILACILADNFSDEPTQPKGNKETNLRPITYNKDTLLIKQHCK